MVDIGACGMVVPLCLRLLVGGGSQGRLCLCKWVLLIEPRGVGLMEDETPRGA